MRDFKKYVDGFGGKLKNARIHPHNSPLDPKNAVRADGSVKIADSFVEQVNFLAERGVENLEFVVPMLDSSVSAETIAKIIDDLTDRIDAQNLTIELGNDTNISPEELGDGVETTYFPPENYAKIYRNVARAVKSRHQNVKLGLAATAFFDAEYAENVLAKIDDDLVDQISFNPYRDTPESPARQVCDGKIADAPEGKSYAEQENRMKNLAKTHGAELVASEVQFSRYDPDAPEKLAKTMKNSAKNGVKTLLWPRKTLPF